MAHKAMLTVLAVAGITALSLLGGCSSDKPAADDGEITAESVRADMSPELISTAETPEQRENKIARSIDTTTRQIWDDWDWIWLLDKPMRMAPYPYR
jgi:hypothetical protein